MRFRSFNLIVLLILFAAPVTGQQLPTFFQVQHIPVEINDTLLKYPWAGGLNNPQFSGADLNNNGIEDLFVFDRSTHRILTFKNNSAPGETDYTYAPELAEFFPVLENWAFMLDFSCDGIPDILSWKPGLIQYHEGFYNDSNLLEFIYRDTFLFNSHIGPINIFATPDDLPAIVDIDGDGDFDILTFPILGRKIELFKNMSMEQFGNCDSNLVFELANDCWGEVYESGNTRSLMLIDTCDNYFLEQVEQQLHQRQHPGSTLLILDENGNGLYDLIIGNIQFNTLTRLINGGTADSAKMISQDTLYPSYNISVDVPTFPSAFHTDVNNDGRKDLLVAPNAVGDNSESYFCSWYYKDIGTGNAKVFQLQTNSFLVEDMIDIGKGAYPAFFDYNNDNLMDLVIGNYGYFDGPATVFPGLALFENIGTVTAPAFKQITINFAGVNNLQIKNIAPTFGDLDGDGDMDMLLGDHDGNLHYFENTAALGTTANFVLTQPNFSNIDVGLAAIPQLIDVNSDGRLDILVGSRNGEVQYFENKGTVQTPFFFHQPINPFFGNVDVRETGIYNGYSAPHLTTIDSTGQRYLFVGNWDGRVHVYEFDPDSIYQGSFKLITKNYLDTKIGTRSAVAVADLNNSGNPYMVVGNWQGGLALFNPVDTVPFIDTTVVQPGITVTEKFFFNLYPNPTNGILNLQFNQDKNHGKLQLKLYDVTGREMWAETIEPAQFQSISITIPSLSEGIYFLQLKGDKVAGTKKVIVKK